MTWAAALAVFGTTESPHGRKHVSAGGLSIECSQGAVEQLRWEGIEVIRHIDCAVRDENWRTFPSTVTEEQLRSSSQEFEWTVERSAADGALTSHLLVSGSADGTLSAVMELRAHRELAVNRAGLTILHPLDGLTGSTFKILKPDASIALGEFPSLISPRQLASDIAGLVYSVHGVQVDIRFDGEIFEMEDQRNWSDASFKTYCRPLRLPAPYVIARGQVVRQQVQVRLQGKSSRPSRKVSAGQQQLRLSVLGERVPVVALALEASWGPSTDAETALVRLLEPHILQLRVTHDSVDRVLAGATKLIAERAVELELEIVIPRNIEADEYLASIAAACAAIQLPVARVIALPEAYLQSYQPDGSWPSGTTPAQACSAARRWFPKAQIGGGVLTHFVELNRCRPDISLCEYITHGSTAILHAADDRSVIQSLEGLEQVYASAKALARGRDYRLGLVAIGMRSNPHGSDVALNPEQLRIPMARVDPRQRGLFAAAWALGAVAATESHSVVSLALAAPVGPFGVLCRPEAWQQPISEESASAAVFPLYHVVRALSQVAGAPRLALHGAAPGIVGIAAQLQGSYRLILTNLGEEPCTVAWSRPALVRRLDRVSFQAAIEDPDWLMTAEPETYRDLRLSSFEVAFIDLPTEAA